MQTNITDKICETFHNKIEKEQVRKNIIKIYIHNFLVETLLFFYRECIEL